MKHMFIIAIFLIFFTGCAKPEYREVYLAGSQFVIYDEDICSIQFDYRRDFKKNGKFYRNTYFETALDGEKVYLVKIHLMYDAEYHMNDFIKNNNGTIDNEICFDKICLYEVTLNEKGKKIWDLLKSYEIVLPDKPEIFDGNKRYLLFNPARSGKLDLIVFSNNHLFHKIKNCIWKYKEKMKKEPEN